MLKPALLMVSVPALALALSGCASLFGSGRVGPIAQSPEKMAVTLALESTENTDVGRAHLAAGNPGLAIEAFQKAMGNGEPVAAATNGMAVAYARIGRPDLALRFFRQASAAEPENPKYAANMMKLLSSPAAPVQALPLDRPAAVAAEGQQGSLAQSSANLEGRSGALQRVSRVEVKIVTLPPQPAPVVQRAAVDMRAFRPLVRLSIGKGDVPAAKSFVRITLPPPTPSDGPILKPGPRAGA
ncbi:tetratricopeptide repeat protein [Parafrankia sp. BMG5.11]|uniref:tetratricopeptide repeat protein n=1 Tax=Parafrankia sp. BMG5.11 TaxID=222540 RepID=UPI002681F1B7